MGTVYEVLRGLHGVYTDSAAYELLETPGRAPRLSRGYRAGKRLAELLGTAVVRATVDGPVEVTIGDTTVAYDVRSFRVYREVCGMSEVDRAVVADLLETIEDDDVFWDVGAHLGTFTYFAGRNCAETVTVEAQEPNVRYVEAQLARNGLDSHLYSGVLASENGRMVFVDGGTVGSYGHLVELDRTDEVNSKHAHEVGTVTGDRLRRTEGLPPPTVLKVDVGGSEYHVLRGLAETIAHERCRCVYCNVLQDRTLRYQTTPDDVEALLERAGFDVETLVDWTDGYYVKATA